MRRCRVVPFIVCGRSTYRNEVVFNVTSISYNNYSDSLFFREEMLRIFLRTQLTYLNPVKPASVYVSKNGYCEEVRKVAKRKTKRKKQKIHKDHGVVKYVMENFLTVDGRKHKNNKLGVLDTVKEDLVHHLQTNTNQLFGFSIEELVKRIDLLRATGITRNDAVILSLTIPSCLHINNNNFRNVIKTLQKHELPVEKILYKHPFVGSVEHIQLERNLGYLSTPNLKSELTDLIMNNPVLLSYQLNQNCLSILDRFGADSSQAASQQIQMSLADPGVQSNIANQLLVQSSDNNWSKENQDFFFNYNIDLAKLYQICPDILMATKETLEKSLERVVSSPFYFQPSDVESLIMSYPDVFISFHKDNVKAQVEYLEKILISNHQLYKLLSEHPDIFRDPDKFFQRVEILKTHRFKDAEIGQILAQKGGVNCFLDCDDHNDQTILKLLKLYLKHRKRDIKPIQVAYSSPICLSTKAFPNITQRLKFLRHTGKVNMITTKKRFNKKDLTLRKVIRYNQSRFLELCGSTEEEFEKFVKSIS